MFFFFTASTLPYRSPSTNSSLIPFPRVGRSMLESLQKIKPDQNEKNPSQISSRSPSKSHFYVQKRTGKSRVIPFSSVGRMSDPLGVQKVKSRVIPFSSVDRMSDPKWTQKSIQRGTPLQQRDIHYPSFGKVLNQAIKQRNKLMSNWHFLRQLHHL